MRPSLVITSFIAVSFLASTLAFGVSPAQIGIVKSSTGSVMIERGGSTITAEPNLSLFEGDLIKTGADSKAGLILADDTIVSMGASSSVAIKNYQFQPHEKKLSLIARILHGTASFLSGQIDKLAPKEVHIETPYATIGVRGTHVLVRVD